jgi:hypothetical protein
VAAFDRNRWPLSIGIGGRLPSESVAALPRIPLVGHAEQIRQWVAERPDITLSELRARLARDKVTVSQSAIHRFLCHLNMTFKKSPARGRAGSAGRRRRA